MYVFLGGRKLLFGEVIEFQYDARPVPIPLPHWHSINDRASTFLIGL